MAHQSHHCMVNITEILSGEFDKESELPAEGPLNLEPGSYTIMYDYPLAEEVIKTHELSRATTLMDILKLVANDYKSFYETNGGVNIWGHGISDLCVECIGIDYHTHYIDLTISS